MSVNPDRPKVYVDCLPGGINAQRPCPWVSCRYNLALTDGLPTEIPGWDDGRPTCVLDLANSRPRGTDEIAKLLQIPETEIVSTIKRAVRKLDLWREE